MKKKTTTTTRNEKKFLIHWWKIYLFINKKETTKLILIAKEKDVFIYKAALHLHELLFYSDEEKTAGVHSIHNSS
jgi:hypothetical protein